LLSTLHTNDAVGALPRLLDMGIAPFLVSSTTNLIVAQRLVRKICQNCITSYQLTKQNIAYLTLELNIKELLKVLQTAGAISKKQTINNLLFYRGKGCKQCGEEGYKGRQGIYEVLEITRGVADLILNRASADQLKTAAKKQGMLTMMEDGFIKAKNGITTIEEIIRVTKE